MRYQTMSINGRQLNEHDTEAVMSLIEENHRLLAANRDCMDNFDALKADYDALKLQYESLTQDAWVPITEKLIDEKPDWLYNPMWLAEKGGRILQGRYEWRQGRFPDRFFTDAGDFWVFEIAYVMPLVKPTHPQTIKEPS